MLTMFFAEGPVTDYESASASDVSAYATFFHEMLARGIYLAPSAFEAAFISTAHCDDDVRRICEASEAALKTLS
jgi:glutamate-1-semialdehyde 2,1-aminomutase